MVIAMYPSDHAPPHFHVRVSGKDVTVDINDLTIIEGRLSPRLRGPVMKWAARYQEELRQNWIRAQQRAPLMRIPPLE
jgi:hypothetical protein